MALDIEKLWSDLRFAINAECKYSHELKNKNMGNKFEWTGELVEKAIRSAMINKEKFTPKEVMKAVEVAYKMGMYDKPEAFKTEDGVHVSVGEHFYEVDEMNPTSIRRGYISEFPFTKLVTSKYFSTPQLAGEYVDNHRLVYSKHDLTIAHNSFVSEARRGLSSMQSVCFYNFLIKFKTIK